MKKHVLSLLLLWVIFALAVTSCSPGGNQAATPTTGAPGTGQTATVPAGASTQPAAATQPAGGTGEKVPVKLSTWAGVDEAKELQAIIDKLNAAATTYTITQESSPSEYWTKVQTTIAGGTAADLLWVDQEHLPDLASRGALLDITNNLSTSQSPAAKLDDYFETTINAYRFQDKMYGLPWIGMPVMLYVNLDYLKDAGIDEAQINNWKWEDFRNACIKLTKDANGNTPNSASFDTNTVRQYGFSVVPGWPPVQQFIWQAGGEVISKDMKTVPLELA